jgi:aldehyde:ferredoxin oxidoreductase
MESLERSKQWKMDLISDALNVRCFYRSGSLKAVARELTNCKFNLVGQGWQWISKLLYNFYGVRNNNQVQALPCS